MKIMTSSPARFVAIIATVGLLATACKSAEPSPTPTLGSFRDSTREVTVISVSPAEVVFHASERTPNEPNEAAINAFAKQVADFLDSHLRSLSSKGTGRLDAVAAEGLLDGADPELRKAVSSDLATPDRPAASAQIDLTVAHDGPPKWAVAKFTVTAEDGSRAAASFVVLPAGEDLLLIALGPAEPAEPAEAPTPTSEPVQ